MINVNEKTSFVLDVSFFDENDLAVTPDTVQYRIDDKTSTNEILDWTPVSASTTVSIDITRTDNTIIDVDRPSENKVVTVEFTYGGGAKGGTEQYTYTVRNLRFFT